MKILITTALLFILTSPVTAQIQPSAPLPESGQMIDYSTNTIYRWQDHGRTYQSYGSENITQRQGAGGNIVRYGVPKDDNGYRQMNDVMELMDRMGVPK